MRRLTVVILGIILAASLTAPVSIFDVSEAQAATSDPASTEDEPYFLI